MRYLTKFTKWLLILTIATFFINCGGGGGSNSNKETPQEASQNDEFTRSSYRGLNFYYKNMSPSNYKLIPLEESAFDSLSKIQKIQVAEKLLSTLFFGYPLNDLEKKVDSGVFLETLRTNLETETTDKEWLENYILDEEKFGKYKEWAKPQAITILTRFYAMKDLDSYFLNNWIAYILTQTIMFSPAYELDSSHSPDISRVYNRLVTMLGTESGMRYITYVHMMSEDNWRRFRSPEDNGREMLEIFLQDTNDSHVPLAAQALKNWKLNTESDTLEVSLNQNHQPLKLFNTTIYNGDDFYRELVKSTQFTKGVTKRLVDFFFTESSEAKKVSIINSIVSSKPNTWQDILLQIIFSEEYLLHTERAKSAEENFFPLAKKIDFKHQKSTFYHFKDYLEKMHQASMKYKLGKLNRVPLDTLSFAYYHKFIRDSVLLKYSNPKYKDNYASWGRSGWSDSFIDNNYLNLDSTDDVKSLDIFVNYLFTSIVSRQATTDELKMFRDHIIMAKDGKQLFRNEFNIFISHNEDLVKEKSMREDRKRNIATIVLDYLSRLEATYQIREVK